MNKIELFGEFALGLQKLTVTITANDLENYKILVSTPNIITIDSENCKHKFVLDSLELAPNSCNISQQMTSASASFTLLAKSFDKRQEDRRLDHMFSRLIKGEQLLCKFCQAKVVNLTNVSKCDSLLPVDTLAGLEPSSFFCHTNKSACADNGSPLSRAASNLSPMSALCNGVEVIFSSESWYPDSTLELKDSEGLFCRRCRLMLGRVVGSGSDAVPVLWTNCVTVWTKEMDVDGDYLRHIEIPFIPNDVDFFDFLFSQFLEAKCYRILLSAGTVDGPVDYALLWLFDQRSILYNSTLEITPPRAVVDNTGDISEGSFPSAGDSEGSIPSDVAINQSSTPDRTSVSRVLYKLVVNLATSNSNECFDAWTKDFSVLPVTLTWETCVLLTTYLNQVTNRLPPQARFATGPLDGFIVGGIPTRNY